MTIGERINSLLSQDSGLTAAALARHLNTAQSTVSGWIKGGRVPGADKVIPICEFLGVSTNWLLTGEDGKHEIYSQVDRSFIKSPYSKMEINGFDALGDFEKELLKIFKGFPPDKKVAVLAQLYKEEAKGPRMVPPTPQGPIEFENLSLAKRDVLVAWINENLTQSQQFNKKNHVSFLRNLYHNSFSDDSDHYVTRGEFCGAMSYCGFEIAKTDEGRYYFNVEEDSPAIQKHFSK